MSARRLLAALIIGAVAGSALATGGAARRLEALRVDRDRALKDKLQLGEELERLRQEGAAGRGCRIGQVEVLVISGDGGVDQGVLVEVERRAEKLTRDWAGRRCEDLHPLLLMSQFQGRIEAVEGRLYRLQLLGSVIGPHTVLHLAVSTAPAPAQR